MLKMYTKDKKWIVIDGEREIVFDNAKDAWDYTWIMRVFKPAVPSVPKSCYPVTSLIPNTKKKKVRFKRGEAK